MTNQHFVFLCILLSTIVSSAASVAGSYLEDNVSLNIVSFQYLFHDIYYLSHNVLPICFALYILRVTGSSSGGKKATGLLFSIPFLLCELMVLTNRFTSFVFYIDDKFIYHRGKFITVIYACGVMYFILGFVFFFKYKKAISKNDSRTVGLLLAISAVGIVLQAVNSDLAVELFAESLTIAGLLLMVEERSGYVDNVTGALNRIALIDNSRRLIENGQRFSIVLVKLTDIDHLSKLFNGREIEDLLIQVSEWLTSVSSGDSLYYYRSYDFAILYRSSSDDVTASVVEKILKRFESEWKYGEVSLRLEVVLSVLRIPTEVHSMDDLMDILTSEYKKTGKGSKVVPYSDLNKNQKFRETEQALRKAVDNNLLRVWYQPIWSVEKKRTIAAEALLRIDSDELRCISPDVFIPVAEQSGIISEIGLFVFKDVCRFLKSISDKDFGIEYIEINLSVYQFMYDDIVLRFESIRKEYDISPNSLNLEITESAAISDKPIVEQTMSDLHDIGYSFSLDDFGTGYSTWMQFISSTYTNIKIDKSLLWKSDKNERTASLLDSLIRLIREMGYNVVQEGVETKAQLERTESSGGNLIQGYYFSKPIPEFDFIKYLEREKFEREKLMAQ